MGSLPSPSLQKLPENRRKKAKRLLNIFKEGGVGKYLGLPEHFGRKMVSITTSQEVWIVLAISVWLLPVYLSYKESCKLLRRKKSMAGYLKDIKGVCEQLASIDS